MARDGSGNYNPPSPENPVTSGTTIDADDHNVTVADMAAALTGSIAKDGQTVPTANLPQGGFRHTNVGNATARDQYNTVACIQDHIHTTVGSISGTDTIIGSLSPAISAYISNMTVSFTPTNTITGAATLNINGVAARAIVTMDGAALVAGDIEDGVPAVVVYDLAGTQWYLQNPIIWTNSQDIGSDVQAWDADLDAISAVAGVGLATRTAADTWTVRDIDGTSNRVVVNDGDGVGGNPTVDISASYVGQASITTLGTVSTGTWAATDVAITAGGTGASDAGTARTNLGLGTIATQNTIDGGDWSGTDLAIVDGGTGTSTATGTGDVVLASSGPSFPNGLKTQTLEGLATGGVQIFGDNTTLAAVTEDRTATGQTSGMTVSSHQGTQRDVGFNVLPQFNWETSGTASAEYCGHVTGASTAGGQTLTTEIPGTEDFPVGGIVNIVNGDNLDYNVIEGVGSQINYLKPGSGLTDTTGGITIGPGGVVTLYRFNAAIWYVWGSEISFTA